MLGHLTLSIAHGCCVLHLFSQVNNTFPEADTACLLRDFFNVTELNLSSPESLAECGSCCFGYTQYITFFKTYFVIRDGVLQG